MLNQWITGHILSSHAAWEQGLRLVVPSNFYLSTGQSWNLIVYCSALDSGYTGLQFRLGPSGTILLVNQGYPIQFNLGPKLPYIQSLNQGYPTVES